jgi:hypothetical protein
MRNIFTLIVVAILTSGCATTSYWTMTDDMNRVAQSNSFQMSVPEGWVRSAEADTWEQVEIDNELHTILLESMTVTRDGTSLHAITVTRRYADNAFPTLKKKSTASMLPVEVADLYVAELRKRNGLERLEILSNKPAQVDGKQGFQLVLQYRNDDGLRVRVESYGFVDKTGFYTINYRAPYLYYYDRDRNAFTELVQSFRQLPGANEPPPKLPRWVELFT